MKKFIFAMMVSAVALASVHYSNSYAQEKAAAGPEKKARRDTGESPLSGPRVDVANMARPLDIHDTVWLEDMTSVEVRDSIKAGKTTVLIIAGGMEDNGPYLPIGKHGTVMKIEAEAIARKLGNALIAPLIVTVPGNLEKPGLSGSIVLSKETYHAVLSDMATSLQHHGFKNIFFMGDHGSDQQPDIDVAKEMNAKYASAGVLFAHIPEYYNYADVQKYEKDVLGINEKAEGYHDDYYSSVIVMTQDLNHARIPERIKAKLTTINSVPLVPTEKAVADGKKIVDFRADAAVKAIQKLAASHPH